MRAAPENSFGFEVELFLVLLLELSEIEQAKLRSRGRHCRTIAVAVASDFLWLAGRFRRPPVLRRNPRT